MREAAHAEAVSTLPPDFALPADVAVVYRLAREYSDQHGMRVVFFSDLTRELDRRGMKWHDVGVDDWVGTQEAMLQVEVAGLFMTISYRAHAYLCDATREGITWHYPDGTTERDPTEKERVRAAFQEQLDRDWPDYIAAQYAKGLIVEYSQALT